jgi:ATP-binding protein involved in chromosome partitioning
MPLTKDSIRDALRRVQHPALATDIVSAQTVRKVAYCDGYASLTLAGAGEGAVTSADHRAQVTQQAAAAVRLHAQQQGEALQDVHIEFSGAAAPSSTPLPQAPKPPAAPRPPAPQNAPTALPGVKHIVAVGAGKGGVGKSTVSVNLAVGLARRGHAVGLLDGDIYGPSLPTLLGLNAMDPVVIEGMLQPFYVHGVKAMTIGRLVDADKPLIWRGPMAHGAFKQLTEQTAWGELDYLIIDLPPGTGDVSLTMAQVLRLTGAVLVCTPQKVAQDDAVRAAKMFQQLNIDVLGVVENMSTFIADDLTPQQGGPREYDLFGRGGAQTMAQRLGLPFLGALPLYVSLRKNSDAGDPTANYRAGPLARDLEALVTAFESQVALASLRQRTTAPELRIS